MSEFSFLFPLPKGAIIKVKENQSISPQDILAQYPQFEEYKINLVQLLGVPPKTAGQYLTISLGSKIKANDVIATRSTLWGKKNITTPIDGQIYAFDNQDGNLIIRIFQKKINIHLPVSGKIEKIKKEGIKILASGEILAINKGQGSTVWGKTKLYQNSLPSLTKDEKGKILLVKTIVNRALLNKSKALGIKGIISNKDIPPITASLSLATIIDGKDWTKLEEKEGKTIILDPAQKKLAIINS